MNVSKISFGTTQSKQPNGKTGFLEGFYNYSRNNADMTDAIMVPRTIFKGYLGIMTGTTLITLGSVLNKYSKVSKTLSISGLLASLYGTWAFVRPFIIKDTKGVTSAQDLKNQKYTIIKSKEFNDLNK